MNIQSIDEIYQTPLGASRHSTLFFKRAVDIVGSSVGLVILFPLFLVVAIMIKLDSKGTVLFMQDRLGRYGVPYEIIKFRTMVQNADKMASGLYSFNGDLRITKVGNWLRNTSIDELPQLFNVWIGNMSLIGPRPPVVNELGDFDTLNSRYKRRFRVKPGMSGLAQVTGRNGNTWDNKVNFDNEYIEKLFKYGFWYDFTILFRTVRHVFKKQDIVETKIDDSLDDIAAAKAAEAEIIRLAHTPEAEEMREPVNV